MRSVLTTTLLVALLAAPAIGAATPANHACLIDGKQLPERSRQMLMGETTFRRLEAIQELFGAGDFNGALERLRELEPRVQGNPYEHAIILQMFGYTYVQMERYGDSISYLQRAVELDAMPDSGQQQTMQLLYNMYAATEDWSSTIAWIDRYCQRQVDVPSDALILAASSRAQLERHRDAIPFVRRAIDKSDDPKENWYQLLLAMHYELNEYREATDVLEVMVSLWPTKKRYWDQLASLYMELEEDGRALATMGIAYRNGMTTEERELLNLARMYLFMEIPEEAAQILEDEIRSGRIEANLEHLELLGNAWTQAREMDEAIAALSRAAELAEDGELYVRMAQLQIARGYWADAIDAIENGVRKGDLDKPGRAYLLQGMAAAELKDFGNAITYFRRAERYEDSRRQAQEWIRYMQEELAVQAS